MYIGKTGQRVLTAGAQRIRRKKIQFRLPGTVEVVKKDPLQGVLKYGIEILIPQYFLS
jgi:hypothetical protein